MLSNSLRRVAIVTGAASGIGKSVALRLAKDGYKLSLCDLKAQSGKLDEVGKLIQKENPETKIHLQDCDVSKEAQVKDLVDDTVKHFGRLDCVRRFFRAVVLQH